MKLGDLHPSYSEQVNWLQLSHPQDSLWSLEVEKVIAQDKLDFNDTTEILQALHELQRVSQIFAAGLESNQAFRDQYDELKLPLWKQFISPPVSDDLVDGLAKQLYNITLNSKDVALLQIANGARSLGENLFKRCIDNKIPTIVDVYDTVLETLLINHATDEGVKNLGARQVKLTSFGNKRMAARAGMLDEPDIRRDERKGDLYSISIKPYRERLTSGDLFYTLTEVPTPKDATIEGMPYKDYLTLFFEMCNQPWTQIGKAQEKLIAELDAAKTLRFTNSDGTDISMNIEGFTFCNSLVAKNVPGSEVFSAPRRDSVNGVIVSRGRFVPPQDDNSVIENLRMEFTDGRLTDWSAEKGAEHFARTIGIDDGAKYVGEIGIGTNPHLRQHVTNGLLVEKIGGSFHVALGRPYTYTEYVGKPVTVNNGGKSALHWDITTMLQGKEGRMYIDGREVMRNGLWLDPDLDVLNRGWAAVPLDERPDYWNRKLMATPSQAPRSGPQPA